MVTVEQLYKDYGVLADAGDKAGQHEAEYRSILSAVSAGASEKKLAAQFIPRFFKFFSGLAETAINAQLDLCEDDDCMIRRAAIKELPNLCRESTDHLLRIADVLAQLLQSDDPQEISIVNSALMSLYKIDMKGTLGGLFSQILSGEDLVRERAIKFLNTRLKLGGSDNVPKEVEEFVIEKTKEVLTDVTGEEFVTFMQLLSKMPSMQTLTGRQQMVELVAEQADLESQFLPQDPDIVDRLVQCVREALQFFSKNVPSNKFVVYMCDNVLPVLGDIVPPGSGETKAEETEDKTSSEKASSDKASSDKASSDKTPSDYDVKLELLRQLAEMATYAVNAGGDETLGRVFDKLLEYMPLPPAETEGESLENGKATEEPKLQFSYVECLMYTFYQLAKKLPDFLVSEENSERLKDFRVRLQYFARGTQLYMKQLRLALQGKVGDEMKKEENRLKVVALRVTTNINTLTKDLFRNPPSYKSTVVLSWRPVQKHGTSLEPAALGQKRTNITPITFSSDPSPPKKAAAAGGQRKPHAPRVMYQPPSGKYSSKAGMAPSDPEYGVGYTYGGRGARQNQWRGGSGRGRGRSRGGKWWY
ncbi:apoptosis inhibitor 5-like [Acanthaster planci]|uniref:Apoptosis inhibitor 5-like n=1 Tax=Acanthaster planci TaxID=133434 RepID=A0A8B7XRS6_ACAPL|nr:apoptosis inhibitor 5-like [Acanthaster planci]